MSVVDNTCRTCGKPSDQEDGSDLHPMYTSVEYHNELTMVQEEFEIWNLNIAQSDGLPQKICLTCFDSFCQIHNFRLICQEAQVNFGELCTGLDIIIKVEPENGDIDADYPDDFDGEQTITVQERYQFPGDVQLKLLNLQEEKTCEKLLETVNSDEECRIEQDRNEEIEEQNAVIPEFKQFQCKFCMDVVGFDDPELLNQHYNLHHSTDLPYGCPKCEKCFDNKSKRNSHARVHYRIVLDCPICNKKVRGGKRMMAQHHEFYHIEKDRECKTCGKKFIKTTLKRFRYHMSWHDETKLHKCKFCDKKFIQLTHLVVHQRTHTGESPFVCSECGSVFKNSGLLYSHLKTHGKGELTCNVCKKKFFHPHGLRLHMLMHDQKIPKQGLRCNICDKAFGTCLNLDLHNYNKHGALATASVTNVLNKRKIKPVLIKPYKCGKCPQSFVLHTQLMKHLKTHDEYRPYTCEFCQKSFKREAHLKLHVNSIHLNKKPYKCTICGWAFILRNNLKQHIAAKHETRRDFKCEICGKEFAIAKVLKTHMIKHTDEKPFTCTICNKSFRMLTCLKSHVNNHLKKNEANVAAGDITDIVVGENSYF